MLSSRLVILLLALSIMFFTANCWCTENRTTDALTDNLEILYLFSSSEPQIIPEHVQLAADALGVNLLSRSCEQIRNLDISKKIVGIVVSPDATLIELGSLQAIFTKLQRLPPVLFYGLRPIHQEALRFFGLPVAIESDMQPHLTPDEIIVNPSIITKFFGGMRLPYNADNHVHLTMPGSQNIIDFRDSIASAHFLVKNTKNGQSFFLLSGTNPTLIQPLLSSDDLLLDALPYLIFFSQVGGDQVWQGSGLFANFTIDDPFLVEPYGNLSFKKLVDQMDSHRFHTTIAFIPRNFERNERDTVALFHSRPDRFSIAVHGNNHDRKEFYRYSSNSWLEPFATKTLQEHEFNLAQALVRMNEFSKITGIPFDPVMIFPQEISPAPTLGLCKKLGYIATINGSNVPLDSELPRHIQMSFRPYISSFYGFPSFKRTKVIYYSEIRIRADLFLGNPLLFYAHHDFFESGPESFNSVADLINNIAPQIKWGSVGKIVNQWFLWRRTRNNTIEVRMPTSAAFIVNSGIHEKQYEISKQEDDTINILSIMANGKPVSWRKDSERVRFNLDLLPGDSTQLAIQYSADVHPSAIGLYEGDSYMFHVWRGLSEFRDRILSSHFATRVARDFFYQWGLNLWIPILSLYFVIIAVVVILFFWFQRARSKSDCT